MARSRKARRRSAPRRAPRPARRAQRRSWVFGALLAALVGFGLYVAYLDYVVRDQFEGKRWSLPARVFARPLELYGGRALDPAALERELALLGYRRSALIDEPGTFSRQGERIGLATRGYTFAEESEPARRLTLEFAEGTLTGLADADSGRPLALARVEPVLIANIYPQHNEDRLLVRLDEVPPVLVQALIAVEDRRYYEHHGIDPRAVGRALLANLRAGRTVQGGSTLTQQLVKNFYLSSERTLWRKFNEAIMALLLDAHYDKDEILEAYLNEIYLGQEGSRAIHGFGLAADFYFRRPLRELDAPQLALLVALVRGPGYYDPRRFPERARQRRDYVLDELAQAGVLNAAEVDWSKAQPLGVTPKAPSGVTPFPAYLDVVRAQLRRDYREEDLRSEGLFVFTAFDPVAQLAAERALSARLASLERARGLQAGTLEGAVVVATAEQGEVVAVVGGRDARFAGFNRALEARRPIGSLVKPAIYLAALSRPEAYTLATRVDDGPLEIEQAGGETWAPQNYDHEFHGQVMLLDALVNSYNLATARIGLAVGLPAVIDTLRELGVEAPLNPYPSLLLGATGLTPIEVAQMYQTLAAGGYRAPLRAIREVKDRGGETLQRYPLEVERAAEPATVYLVTAALHEVTRRGTAAALPSLLPEGLAVAGKTGTTDDLRDSWFAGYTGQHVAVAWVGRDDNQSTGLSGASGAMPVWAETVRGLGSAPLRPVQPDAVEWVVIDPATGLRTQEYCAGAQWVPFIRGSAPEGEASCAGGALQRTFQWFKGLFD